MSWHGNKVEPTDQIIPPPEDGSKFTLSAAGKASRNEENGVTPNYGEKITVAGSIPQAFNSTKLKFFDFNLYATKKSVSSALLDVALLMANASQLKSVLNQGDSHPYYYSMVILLGLSITLQALVGVALIILGKMNINEPDDRTQKFADVLNTMVVVGVFFLVIVNVFISSFGISGDKTIYPSPTIVQASDGHY